MKCIPLKNIELHKKSLLSDSKRVASFLRSQLHRLTSFQSYPSTSAAAITPASPTKYRNKTQQILR